jgi:hypothetical protein
MTVTLKKNYSVENSLYKEDCGVYEKGTVGQVLDLCAIKDLPGITPEKHEELVAREIEAKERCHFLVMLGWKVVSLPVSVLKFPNEKEE